MNSANVIISANNVSGAGMVGIDLCGNLGTVVAGNLISGNRLGLSTCFGSGEWMHHNRFVDNGPGRPQATDQGSNRWDDGSEGNWWSDLTGPDENQDGIVDKPYSVGSMFQVDRFPLCPPEGCWWSGGLIVSAGANRTRGPAPLDVAFNSTVLGGVPPHTFAWDFGDGGTASTQNATHRYASPGIYLAELTVEDSAGAQKVAGPISISARESEPPRVLSTSPAEGQLDVPPDTPILVRFSAEMDPFSTEAAISISPQHDFAPTWSADRRNLSLDPAGDLPTNSTHQLRISASASSASGVTLGRDFFLNFTTTATIPPERPRVIKTAPRDGESGVPLNAMVEIIFSVPMDRAATESAVVAVPPAPGPYAWSEDSRTLTLDPSADFLPDAVYEFKVGRGARSAAGARPESDHVFAFTSGSAPDFSPPAVSHVPPISIDEGSDTLLLFAISDPSGVKSAELHYRSVGGSFASLAIFLRVGSEYVALLPSAAAVAPRVEYYVEVEDRLGNRGWHPSAGPDRPLQVPVGDIPPSRPDQTRARELATFTMVGTSAAVIALFWWPARNEKKPGAGGAQAADRHRQKRTAR